MDFCRVDRDVAEGARASGALLMMALHLAVRLYRPGSLRCSGISRYTKQCRADSGGRAGSAK